VIVTLTPNPSVDLTLVVDRLAPGTVHRASSDWSEPSGKGVNVSLALHAHGVGTRAVLPVGGPNGTWLAAKLEQAGIDHVCVPIAGNIRTNVSIVEPDGKVTKVNAPGPTLSAAEIEALLDATLKAASQARWLVGTGSLPHGVRPDLYERLAARAHQAGLRAPIWSSPTRMSSPRRRAGPSPRLARPSTRPAACRSWGPGRSWPAWERTVRSSSKKTW
jgi:1-phosphofructokinase